MQSLNALLRLAQKLAQIGPLRVFAAVIETARNKALHLIYGFDPWHVTGNFYARPYKAKVIDLIAIVPHQSVVEIGVGLGDILGRVQAPERLGIDLDAAVLKAARWCVGSDVTLAIADFSKPETLIAAIKDAGLVKIDMLILVNWIHMIDWDTITATLRAVRAAVPVEHLLMDAIHPGTAGYRFTHRAEDIATLGSIKTIIKGDDVRDFVLVDLHA